MLLQIRHLTRGVIATVILGLVGLAMVAFLIPQGGLQIFPSSDLANVGNRAIRGPQLTRELQLTLRGERQNGNIITQEEAVQQGIHLQLLEGMIGRFALYNYADKLGVSASDESVAARIREIPAVTNPVTGQFDQTAYDAFLGQLGYSRQEFETDIRGDLTTNLLMESLVRGARAPTSYGALLVAYQGETRVVSVAEAPGTAVGQIPAPNEAQLQTFWEENQERLRVPEFRTLTLVYAAPADFVARVEVPEARLREEFDSRAAALTQPERRTYVRIAAQNEAQASDVAARLGRGENPMAVAQALGVQATRGENQTRSEVPDARVAEAVFALRPGAARAVQGQLSPWVVVRLESITAAVAPSFESLRGDIRDAIAADEAGEMMNTAVSTFEDARAAGGDIATAARQANLRVVQVPAVEAQGRDANGEPVPAFVEQADLLRTAFQTPEGEASDFMPFGDADVIVSVDRITPSTVRPLAEVRDDLTQVWIGRERTRRLRDLGEQMAEGVRGGQSFAAAARANGFRVVVTSETIDRQAAAQIPARGMAQQIFSARDDEVVSDISGGGGSVLVAQVEQINRVDLSQQPQLVEAARVQMNQSLLQSFASTVQDDIVARAHVRRNEPLLNQLFPRNAEAEGEEAQ
jgi:peptidyl-prolyl cis-trans isomerase D